MQHKYKLLKTVSSQASIDTLAHLIQEHTKTQLFVNILPAELWHTQRQHQNYVRQYIRESQTLGVIPYAKVLMELIFVPRCQL